ncbi:ABC transporter permease [Niabella hibiscisoli]|uniref:ABC transporter permease n=1 Tax=Niabella hibiscisoli TaxID=1825928 RepID=UPI001F0E9C04|nr:ABC transporter permease [Niabella hibiscisoli]MCH5715243.1 hypothetical protein [Niabella hibiscisoli]
MITEEIPLIASSEIEEGIRKTPNVHAVYPFATRYAILKTKDELQGILVKGLDKSYDFNNLKEFIIEGTPIHFNDSTYSRDIMISKKTAQELHLKVNDRVSIYFIRPDGSKRRDKLTISGIFKTDIGDFDNSFAIGDIQLIRRLNNWQQNQIGGYEVMLQDFKKQIPLYINCLSYRALTKTGAFRISKSIFPIFSTG